MSSSQKSEWYFFEQPALGGALQSFRRFEARLTVPEFAAALGTSTTTIYAWQQGRAEPSMKSRRALMAMANKTK